MACFPVPLASQGFGIGILNRLADKRKTIPIAILMPNKRNNGFYRLLISRCKNWILF